MRRTIRAVSWSEHPVPRQEPLAVGDVRLLGGCPDVAFFFKRIAAAIPQDEV